MSGAHGATEGPRTTIFIKDWTRSFLDYLLLWRCSGQRSGTMVILVWFPLYLVGVLNDESAHGDEK